ncbi:pilus assembly PilX N-terminal domain-containing protein [Candidatus Saccharibacteria bacterium]|nr:MAG: pilus assembly PilX N-terminal domain-containing protein [Candidatus Saccharibacteria bacterium]
MVTMILTLVITLVVMGFTQVANRNRREALDRQLSTQAFYAAESGVNSAIDIIKNRQTAGLAVQPQDDCNTGPYTVNPVLSTSPRVEYTCVFVSTTVPDLVVDPSTTSAIVIPIDLTDKQGGALPPATSVDIEFEWTVAEGASTDPTDCPSYLSFPANNAANQCGYGLLRFDLMQMTAFNSAASAANITKTFFMQPVISTPGNRVGITNFGDPKGHIVPASCTAATQSCKAVIRVSVNAMTPLLHCTHQHPLS